MTVDEESRRAPARVDQDSAAAARPAVTVVICAYSSRRLEILTRAVASVRDQLHDGDELLVVVDHNQSLLDAARNTLADGQSRVIANENQRGLSGARNSGIAVARGELIAFLDDDAVPRPGWLEQLTAPFADPEVIGAGGVAAPAWAGQPPAWLPEEFLWVVGCSYRGLPEAPAEIRNPIGANMAFRRSAISRAGGFTNGIGRIGRTPLGCEETEFAIRAARMTGGRIVQEPAATVDHLVTTDRARPRYFFHRCWAEGISKAAISKLAGNGAATASERDYTRRTLPAGVVAGLRDGFRGDHAGYKRAAAIVAGLAITVAGYCRGTVSSLNSHAEQSHA